MCIHGCLLKKESWFSFWPSWHYSYHVPRRVCVGVCVCVAVLYRKCCVQGNGDLVPSAQWCQHTGTNKARPQTRSQLSLLPTIQLEMMESGSGGPLLLKHTHIHTRLHVSTGFYRCRSTERDMHILLIWV